ncbi:MAG: serine/threonine protein kinase [Deltaproteobacteria bacterium]|nr:serine/threonine protein kinase [Deltaproteobacteria bacterium]
MCPLDRTALVDLPDPLLGRVLGGRYRLTGRLGEGAMGAVYRARHEQLPREVAVKVLSPDLALEPVYRERFLREARAANRIQHDHVIDITDVGETEDGVAFFVMELLVGRTLATDIAKGPIPARRALRIVAQVASALAHAHAIEVVHRDLKPDNIFLVERAGDRDFVKLIDFGLARAMSDPRLTGSGVVFGTPEYMAPEQARGAPVGPSADLYALGVVLFEMLTSRLPFEGQTAELLVKHIREKPRRPSELVPNVPRDAEEICMRLLEKQPDARFRHAEALHAAVEASIEEDVADTVFGTTLDAGGLDGSSAAESEPEVSPAALRQLCDGWRAMLEQGELARPAWVDEALVELDRTIQRAATLEADLRALGAPSSARPSRVADVLSGLQRAYEELAREELTASRGLEESTARARALEVAAAAARADAEEARRSVASAIAEDLTAELALTLEVAGERSAAWRNALERLEEEQRSIETRERYLDDVRFQLAQIRGRLASLSLDGDPQVVMETGEQLRGGLERAMAAAAELSSRLRGALGDPPRRWREGGVVTRLEVEPASSD